MFVAMFLAIDIMASGGNALAKAYSYVLVASALFGLLFPRPAVIYLIFLSGYLDTFKRLMILDSGVTLRDLYYVLGVAPATMFGILLSVLNSALQGHIPLARGQGRWIFIVLGLQIFIAALSLVAVGRSGRALGDAVNMAAYISLMIVIPLLFRSKLLLAKFIKTVLLIFIPSAIYTIYQSFAGYSNLEIAYLKSGMTIEIKQLYEVTIRPFGTMNSTMSASVIFGMLGALALVGPWGRTFHEEEKGQTKSYYLSLGFPRIVLFLLYATACYVTLGRTGWVTGVLGCILGVVFRHKFLTIITYIASSVAGLTLILGASWILSSGLLSEINTFLLRYSSSDVMDRQLTVNTFSDRLISFANLTHNRELWTPFGWKIAGIPESRKPLIHDAITDLLVKFGYVPWGILIIGAITGVIYMHKVVLRQTSQEARVLAASCAAAVFILGLGCLSSWSQLFVFPVNVYVWLFPGVLAGIHFADDKTKEAELGMSSRVRFGDRRMSQRGDLGSRVGA